MKFIPLVFFLILPAAGAVRAQNSMYGAVKDGVTGKSLHRAVVTLHELNRTFVTDSAGTFRFTGLRSASYHIHVSFVGYASVTETVRVPVQTGRVDISLYPTSIELNEIVVESNHYKTGAKEHTLPMEILDAAYLRKNRKNTFVNSLEDLPGISAINTGVGIAKPVIRGLSFNRIIVNNNGIKQEGQQWGADHGLEIDMFDPGRVEIIKGPNSVLYGSDGMGGVINVLPPPLPADSTFGGSVQGIYKTNNRLWGVSGMAQGATGDKVFRLRLSSQDFADYRVTADRFNYNSYELPIYGNRLKNTAGNERNGSFMAGLKKKWGFSTVTVSNFHQRAGLFTGAVGIPRSYQLTPDGDSRNIDLPRQEINHFKVVSNSNVLLGSNWAEIDAGYQVNRRKERSNPHAHGKGPRTAGTLAHGLTLQTWTLNARLFQQPSANRSRISGVQLEAQQNRRSGFEYLLPDFRKFTAGVFTYEERSWKEKFTATAGLRADYGKIGIRKTEEPIYSDETTVARYYVRNPEINRNFFNVSGGMGLSYYPRPAFNAKVNLATSFRMPAPSELGMNGIHHGTFRHELGDSTLTSERGYQLDLNISFQKKDFSLVISPFAAYYSNYIYLAPSTQYSSSLDPDAFPEGGQVFRYRQHDAVYTGGEVAVEYHPVHTLHLRASWEYVFNKNLDTRLPLPFTPPMSVLGEISYEFGTPFSLLDKPQLRLSFRKTEAQRRTDRNERPTPGYYLLGASAGATLVIGNFKAELLLSAENLTDVRYINHLSRYKLLNLPEQGRNFSVNLFIPFATL